MVRINEVDYLYNLFDNIIEINGILCNIQQKGQYLIIVGNNKSKIDTPPSRDKLVELAITSYLVCYARKRRVEQIYFLLAQYTAKSCLIPRYLGNAAKLLADIQKNQLGFYLKELKLLKNKNFYEVMNLSMPISFVAIKQVMPLQPLLGSTYNQYWHLKIDTKENVNADVHEDQEKISFV